MSATGRLGEHPPAKHSWPSQIALNARATLATLCRVPRKPPVAWPDTAKLLLGAALAVAVVVATMFMLDAWSVRQARGLPAALLTAASRFTQENGYNIWKKKMKAGMRLRSGRLSQRNSTMNEASTSLLALAWATSQPNTWGA